MAIPLSRGEREAEAAFSTTTSARAFAEKLGVRGLAYVIEHTLDTNYPADVFGDGSVCYPSWGSEHGGADIELGVRWVALLRQAMLLIGPAGELR